MNPLFPKPITRTWSPRKFPPAWWKMLIWKKSSVFYAYLVGGIPTGHFFPGRERKSQKYGFQLCYQEMCGETIVSLSLVFKWMITISLSRSERKQCGARRRGTSDLAVTTSQGGPKGIGHLSKQEFPEYTVRKFWGWSFVWRAWL